MSETKPGGFGAVLRRRREELGLSLEDMAASTRIRKTYLQALEDENLQALPGSTYVIGFLRIYSQQLSLPVEPLLADMNAADEREGNADAVRVGSFRRESRAVIRSSRRGWKRLFLLALLLAGVAVVYLGLWTGTPSERSLPARVPSPEPVSQQAVPPEPQPAVTPQPVAPPPVAPPQDGQAEVKGAELAVIPPGGAVVRMLPIAAGAMKVSLDGQEFRAYELQPEQSLFWKVSDSLAAEFSSPGLVRVWVDQQELPVAEYPALLLKRMSLPEARP